MRLMRLTRVKPDIGGGNVVHVNPAMVAWIEPRVWDEKLGTKIYCGGTAASVTVTESVDEVRDMMGMAKV